MDCYRLAISTRLVGSTRVELRTPDLSPLFGKKPRICSRRCIREVSPWLAVKTPEISSCILYLHFSSEHPTTPQSTPARFISDFWGFISDLACQGFCAIRIQRKFATHETGTCHSPPNIQTIHPFVLSVINQTFRIHIQITKPQPCWARPLVIEATRSRRC